jgi:4-methyl-5(b-hydroxyethyl)-thiazole monophosphate biosynthesis
MNQKQVAVLLADGFEELEAVAAIDVLRRAGLDVHVVAVADGPMMRGAHDIQVKADARLAEVSGRTFDAVVLPGGMPGSATLAASPVVRELLRRTHTAGGVVAAVCAAPLALHAAGLLVGKRFTCYPSVAAKITDGIHTGNRTERDGKIVTGQAAGSAVEFALAVVAAMGLPDKAAEVGAAMVVAGH